MDPLSSSGVTDAGMESLLKQYMKYKLMGDVGEGVLKKVTGIGGDLDQGLKHTELQLAIMEKKRRLGLPVSGDDYQDASNNDQSFYSRMKPTLAAHALQAIPGPSTMQHVPQIPFFKVAHAIEDAIPLSAKQGGSFYGKLARAGSFLGSL